VGTAPEASTGADNENDAGCLVRQNAQLDFANRLHLAAPRHIISFATTWSARRHEGLPEQLDLVMAPTRTMVFSNRADAHPPVKTDLTGCPWHDVKSMLRQVGLRPTRQRMALGWILFAKGDRHLTAEMLYEEATKAKVPVSLATVYNTLHQFTDVGLLRQVAVDGSKTYFDTNTSDHHHFFVEGENELVDIPSADVVVGNTPAAPDGYEIARIDIVVRLRRKGR
jgi:Fur family iron response transcriptional regulator